MSNLYVLLQFLYLFLCGEYLELLISSLTSQLMFVEVFSGKERIFSHHLWKTLREWLSGTMIFLLYLLLSVMVQAVVTQALEESGFSKDSSLTSDDFREVWFCGFLPNWIDANRRNKSLPSQSFGQVSVRLRSRMSGLGVGWKDGFCRS